MSRAEGLLFDRFSFRTGPENGDPSKCGNSTLRMVLIRGYGQGGGVSASGARIVVFSR